MPLAGLQKVTCRVAAKAPDFCDSKTSETIFTLDLLAELTSSFNVGFVSFILWTLGEACPILEGM